MSVFTREITFLSNQLGEDNKFDLSPVTKTATFKELSRTDRDQHKLHFMLISIFESKGEEGMQVDSDKLYDITTKAVKLLQILDDTFKEADQKEFLNDGGALINFGIWFLGEKITPFFSQLMMK